MTADAIALAPFAAGDAAPATPRSARAEAIDADRELQATFARESRRLGAFIRRRVADAFEAEDILQDAFFELVVATRLALPIEHAGAWLARVAGNRIVDRFRKRRELAIDDAGIAAASDAADAPPADSLLVSTEPGPDARCAATQLVEAMEAALAELPAGQREVFIAHELDGRSFADLAAESGTPVNTLLARKRYAVLHLRRRLREQHLEP